MNWPVHAGEWHVEHRRVFIVETGISHDTTETTSKPLEVVR